LSQRDAIPEQSIELDDLTSAGRPASSGTTEAEVFTDVEGATWKRVRATLTRGLGLRGKYK
jgi:hypothetical protein